jgi:hypothetical protein
MKQEKAEMVELLLDDAELIEELLGDAATLEKQAAQLRWYALDILRTETRRKVPTNPRIVKAIQLAARAAEEAKRNGEG